MNLYDLYYLNYDRELPRNYGESVGKRGPGNYFKDGYEYDRHPYLSNERKQELKEEEQRELEEYENKVKNNLKN